MRALLQTAIAFRQIAGRLSLVALMLALALGTSHAAQAQQLASPEPIDTVFAFNRICYSQVPNTQGIENMATQLGWKPLSAEDLTTFGNKSDFQYFRGWDVQLGEKFFRLGLTQGPVAQSVSENFPDFAKGQTTSCSLIIGNDEPSDVIAANMQKLANKEPATSNVDEGEFSSTSWAGGNDDFKVFLFNKVSNAGEGGILNVTVISKE